MYNRTKNKEAPFMWTRRVIHPMSLSRMIFTITEKAVFMSALYIIDTKSPVMICKTNVNPNRNPMFHKNEIEFGVGRSSSDFFIRFVIGISFVI